MMDPFSTESLCPVCLRRIPAVYREEAPGSERMLLVKHCPEHGEFQAEVWSGLPAFVSWKRPKSPSFPRQAFTPIDRGCPYDCGLCPEHRQHTCTGLIEVTDRCNLTCPVCYAEAGSAGTDPSLENIRYSLDRLWEASGACNLQLSGGEPTLREDLPQIIALARARGFSFVQVNSNGLRLAREPGYAHVLAQAGLDSVYLQFDGPDDDVYRALRGQGLLRDKLAAVKACAGAHLGLVLVATLAREVNLRKLGDLLRLALDLGPSVRGLHLQPAASFGRFPWKAEEQRVTLPEVLRALCEQAPDLLSPADFHPPGCENALCSFSAVYRRLPQGGISLIQSEENCCSSETASAIPSAAEGARIAKAFTARHWAAPKGLDKAADSVAGPVFAPAGDDFDRFLAQAGLAKRFTLSCMAFQDVDTVDLERVRGCCIHVVSPQGLLVPFCLYNLTARDGTPLYRVKMGREE